MPSVCLACEGGANDPPMLGLGGLDIPSDQSDVE